MQDSRYPDLAKLEERIQSFLEECAASDEFPTFNGVVTGWTLFVDRMAAEDGEKWWTLLTHPDQTGSLTLGHGRSIELATAQVGIFATED